MSQNVNVERLPTAAYLRTEVPPYRDSNNLHLLFDALFGDQTVIVVGPKGVGKSIAFAAWAAKNKVPMVTVPCSADLRLTRLVGGYTIRGNETPFVLGYIPTAIEIANECGRCILNFEEINALTPEAQKLLNPITDWQRRIEVSDAQRVFELKADAKLWVVGSMNTTNYGGTHQLNEDLVSRAEIIALDYPELSDEREILHTIMPPDVAARAKQPVAASAPNTSLLDAVLRLAHDSRQRQGLDYALSTREVARLVQNIVRLGERNALQLLLGKYSGEDRVTLKKRIEAVFPGIALPTLAEERRP